MKAPLTLLLAGLSLNAALYGNYHPRIQPGACRQTVKFAPEAEAARELHHHIGSPCTRPGRASGRG